MIRKFSKPEYMTVEEAEGRFYPNVVLFANCLVENHAPKAGYVVASEVDGEGYEELLAYEDILNKDISNGEVFIVLTKLPYEGEGLFVEFIDQNRP